MDQSTKRSWFNWVGFISAWFAMLLQLILIKQYRQANLFETLICFFSFFSILTNILVALYCTSQLFKSKKSVISILNLRGSVIAITALNLIVGIVYQIILRGIWEPTGLQFLVYEMLHTFIPAFMLTYWLYFTKKEDLVLRLLVTWLWYPFLYFVWIVVRGHFSGFYPYPFVDVTSLGYALILRNTLFIFFFLLVLVRTLLFLGRKINKLKINLKTIKL